MVDGFCCNCDQNCADTCELYMNIPAMIYSEKEVVYMKYQYCISLLLAISLLLSSAFTEVLVYDKGAPEVEVFVYDESAPTDKWVVDLERLDQAWLLAQVDTVSEETFADIITALYIMHTVQYGPYNDYEDVHGEDLSMGSLFMSLDYLSFEYTASDFEGGRRLSLSKDVYIDIYAQDDNIERMDLVIRSIKNGYGYDLRITIPK